MTKSRQELYNQVTPYVDIGDFETFNEKMNVPESREKFYTFVSDYVDIGGREEFESKIKLKSEPKDITAGVEAIIDSPDAPASRFPSYEQKAYQDITDSIQPVSMTAESTNQVAQTTAVNKILNRDRIDDRTPKEKAEERIEIIQQDNKSQLDRASDYLTEMRGAGESLGLPTFETFNEESGLWREAIEKSVKNIVSGEKSDTVMKPIADYFNRFQDEDEQISNKEVLAHIGRGASSIIVMPPDMAKEFTLRPGHFGKTMLDFFTIHAPLMVNKLITAVGLNPIIAVGVSMGNESAIQEFEDAKREIATYPVETLISALAFKSALKMPLKAEPLVKATAQMGKLQFDLALKSITDSVWYRKLTIKEKGVVIYDAQQAMRKNPQIAEVLNNPELFYEMDVATRVELAKEFPGFKQWQIEQSNKASMGEKLVEGEGVVTPKSTPVEGFQEPIIVPPTPKKTVGFVEEIGEVPELYKKIHEANRNNPYTDDLSIEFTDDMELIYGTAEQLSEQLGGKYSPGYIRESLHLLKEGEEGYVKGQETYAGEIEGRHIKGEESSQAILGRRGTVDSYIEDAIVEHIYKGLRGTNPELLRKIEDWQKAVERELLEEELDYFPEGIELFSKVYTHQRLGYSAQNPAIAETLRLPQEIIDEFDALVGANRTGEVDVTPYLGGDKSQAIRLPQQKKRTQQKENAPPLIIGDEVSITYKNRPYTATVTSDTPFNNKISVKIKNTNSNRSLAGQFVDVALNQVSKVEKGAGLKKYQADLNQLPKAKRTQAKADAREFDDLIFENDELLLGDGFEEFAFNQGNMTKTGTKTYIEDLRGKVGEILGIEDDLSMPVARSKALSQLKEAIANPENITRPVEESLEDLIGGGQTPDSKFQVDNKISVAPKPYIMGGKQHPFEGTVVSITPANESVPYISYDVKVDKILTTYKKPGKGNRMPEYFEASKANFKVGDIIKVSDVETNNTATLISSIKETPAKSSSSSPDVRWTPSKEKIVPGHHSMLLREKGWSRLGGLDFYVAQKAVSKVMRESETYDVAVKKLKDLELSELPFPELPKVTKTDISNVFAGKGRSTFSDVGESQRKNFPTGQMSLNVKTDGFQTLKDIALHEELKKQGLVEEKMFDDLRFLLITDKGKKRLKPSATYSVKPFKSKAVEVSKKIEGRYPQKSIKGRSLIPFLINQGVKKSEIEFMGFDEFVKGRETESISVEEIKNYIQSNEVSIRTVEPYDDTVQPLTDTVYDVVLGGESLSRLTAQGRTFASRHDAQMVVNEEINNRASDALRELERADEGEVIELPYGNFTIGRDGDKFFVSEVKDGSGEMFTRAFSDIDNALAEFEMAYAETLTNHDDYGVQTLSRDRLDEEGMTVFEPAGKYERWTIPGGDNYSEVVLEWEEAPPFEGRSHYNDNPETLAHIRSKDRIDVDGNKVLFIEEMQSDWHKEGFEQGYKSEMPELTYFDAGKSRDHYIKLGLDKPTADQIYVFDWVDAFKGLSQANKKGGLFPHIQKRKIDGMYTIIPSSRQPANAFSKYFDTVQEAVDAFKADLSKLMTPDAPFKGFDWLNLTSKKVLNMAVEGGYDKIAFPTGAQVADIYNVRHHVDRIEYEPPEDSRGNWLIRTYDKNNNRITQIPQLMKPDQIKEIYGNKIGNDILNFKGKEIAPDIVDTEGFSTFAQQFELSGVDLETGGEMHKTIYDVQIPGRMAKLVKKYGGKLGSTKFKALESDIGLSDYDSRDAGRPKIGTQPSIDITPKMREVFKEEQYTFSVKKPHKFKNKEVEKRFSEAEKGITKTSVLKQAKDAIKGIGTGFVRKYKDLPRNEKYAPAYEILRQYEAQENASDEKAVRTIDAIVKDLTVPEFQIFQRAVIMQDLQKDLENGKPLPFGLDAENFPAEIESVNEQMTPRILKRIEQRTKIVRTMLNNLVDAGILDKKLLDEDPNYFHHQVLLYNNMRSGASSISSLTKPKPGYGKERKGTELDINANYLQAEFSYLAQANRDLATKKAIDAIIKEYDMTEVIDETVRLESGEFVDHIPEGHVKWQPDKGNVFFTGNTISEKAVEGILEGMDFGDVGEAKELLMESLRTGLIMGGKKKQIVIPEELATTLDQLRPDISRNGIAKLFSTPIKAWKQWTLMSPRRIAKYNLNNTSGDLDAMMAGNPSGAKKIPEATRQMYRAFKYDEDLPQTYWDALDRGVFDAGFSSSEITQVNEMDRFFRLMDNKPNVFTQGWKWYWNKARKGTQFRENIARYASYLDFLEQLESGKTVEQIGYGATSPKMLKGIKGNENLAGILARDLIGDYSNISANGQWVREHLIPFWSFQEINLKRYNNLFANLLRAGEYKKGAKEFGKGLGRQTKRIAGVLAMTASWQAWNRLFHGDLEDELSTMDQGRPHIILGKTDDGKIQTVRFQGALSDYMEWLGYGEAVQTFDLIDRGQATWADLVIDRAKAPVKKLVNGISPHLKIPFEITSGKKVFPDVFKMRSIKDPYKHLWQTVSLENEYDWLTGKPNRGYLKSIKGVFGLYERNVDEINYYEIKDLVNRFFDEKGHERDGYLSTPKSRAMREFKLATKFNDKRALKIAKAKMKALDIDSTYIKKNLKRLNPISSLKNEWKAEFMDGLNARDKKKFEMAMKYYTDTLNPDADYKTELDMTQLSIYTGKEIFTKEELADYKKLVVRLRKAKVLDAEQYTKNFKKWSKANARYNKRNN